MINNNGTVTRTWEQINVDTLEAGRVIASLSMQAPMPSGSNNSEVATVGYVSKAYATLPTATNRENGLMSYEDKQKLDNIEINANRYMHPQNYEVAGTYTLVTVDTYGHIIAGSRPTTLEGFGITNVQKEDKVLTSLIETVKGSNAQGSLLVTGADNLVDRIEPAPVISQLLHAQTPKEAKDALRLPNFTVLGRTLAEAVNAGEIITALGISDINEIGDTGAKLLKAETPEQAREVLEINSKMNDVINEIFKVEYNESTEEYYVPALGAYGRFEATNGYICLGKFFGGLLIYWSNSGKDIKIGIDRSVYTTMCNNVYMQ